MRTFVTILIFLILAMPDVGSAQDALVTDRPDVAEASSTVGHGTLQIETGAVFRSTERIPGGEADKTTSLFTTLLRVGFGKHLELRSEFSYDKFEPGTGDASVSGLGPLALGMKISLWGEDGWIPEAAFIGHVTLPDVGEESFRPSYVAPDFRFALSHTLSDRFTLSYNVGMEWDGEHPEAQGIYALALGAGIFQGLGAYVELFGIMPEASQSRHYIDGGFTYLVSPDLQLDISGGVNIDSESPDSFFSFGFSWRIPRLF